MERRYKNRQELLSENRRLKQHIKQLEAELGAIRSGEGEASSREKETREATCSARLYHELQEADRRKDDFLAMLSHELRNPLGMLGTSVEVMRLRTDNPQLTRELEAAERHVRHITRLVDDLLDISRISKGKLELRKELLDVSLIIQEAIETTRSLIEERRQHLELTQPPQPIWIEGDPTRLEQVLVNLLANAAKYTDPDGTIGIEVEFEAPEIAPPHGAIILRVRDTGRGIAPEMLRNIFDMYAQADPAARCTWGGMGIGLTLVRNLIQMHGGRVEARSAGLGQGSEFIVRLPAAEVPGGRPEALLEKPHPFAEIESHLGIEGIRCRVLVVDDNEDSSRSMGELLELWGHEVLLAYDGPSAIEMAKQHQPDVVLLDIQMPGMDGYEVARSLKADPALRKMVLVALTGYGQIEDQRKSRAAGCDYHFTKPVDLEGLHLLLDRVSGR